VNQPMRRALVVFLITVALGLGAAGVVVYLAFTFPDRPGGSARGDVELEIPKGATAASIAGQLTRAGLIERPTLFRLYTTQRGAAGRIRPGHYKFTAPLAPKQLVDALLKGVADELVAVTIPEGRNLVEVADLLAAAGVAPRTELLAQATSAAFARTLGLPGSSLEGYLFPDTYRLRPHTAATEALLALVRRHRQVYEELATANAESLGRLRKDLGFDDQQVVVLASIVEKETGRPEERPRIAQLFINRLENAAFQPKKLQTDPTIIYGCTVGPLVTGKTSAACAEFTGNNIRRIHLDDPDNPYNTYTHVGLPPGPISNPGRASLAAVMKPDGTPYLYFVARGDGTHHFSVTEREHEAAVTRFQRGGRPRKQPGKP
jgi:UPF0755 protein